MKNEIRFEEMIEMGFTAPAGNLTDFSDAAYNEAAASGKFETIEKGGMVGVFVNGNFKRMKVNNQWISKVDSVESATKFFKG